MTTKYTNLYGKTVQISDYVQEIDGVFYLATWNEKQAQWQGSLRPEFIKTGLSGWSAGSRKGIPGAGGYRYSRRSAAVKKACEIYGLEVSK